MKSVNAALTWLLLKLLRGYQLLFSSFFGRSCRFYPTCSSYAGEALRRFGPWRGSWLALRRLLRCHPFHPGGYDPVPEKVGKTVSDSACSCANHHHP